MMHLTSMAIVLFPMLQTVKNKAMCSLSKLPARYGSIWVMVVVLVVVVVIVVVVVVVPAKRLFH